MVMLCVFAQAADRLMLGDACQYVKHICVHVVKQAGLLCAATCLTRPVAPTPLPRCSDALPGSHQDTLASTFKASAPGEVYDQLDTLLGRLEDPFTRLLRQDDTAAFVAQEEGKVGEPGAGLKVEGAVGVGVGADKERLGCLGWRVRGE
jgi:hypothetical protein